jgi:hypothetical protein
MNLRKMIVELEQEKNRLDEAILALERLSRSVAKRRGRSPRWESEPAVAPEYVDLVPLPNRSREKAPTS